MNDFPYLSRIQIQNYRSIKKLDLTLPRTCVLIGPNGSGKTNFVQAIALFGRILSKGSTRPIEMIGWDNVIRRASRSSRYLRFTGEVSFLLRIQNEEEILKKESCLISLSITLEKNKIGTINVKEEAISIKIDNDVFSVSLNENDFSMKGNPYLASLLFPMFFLGNLNKNLSKKEKTEHLTDLHSAFERLFRKNEHPSFFDFENLRLHNLHLLQNGLLREAIKICSLTRLRLDADALRKESSSYDTMKENGAGLPAVIKRLQDSPSGSREFQNIIQTLREIFPKIRKINTKNTHSKRIFLTFTEEGVKKPFDQNAVSDGMLHALALLVSLQSQRTEAKLLAIEELENAIHPWAIEVLLEKIQERQNRQIILTTHSVEVVNAIKDPNILFVCESSAKGTTITKAINKESALVEMMSESGERLGDVWNAGSIGGVPDKVRQVFA